jgi:hypothetical protein
VTPAPPAAGPSAPASPPTRQTFNDRLAAFAFSWKWWLAGSAALLLSVMFINASDNDRSTSPYSLVAAPLVATLLAAAGRRAGLTLRTRLWVAWPCIGVAVALAALLGLGLAAGANSKPLDVIFGPLLIFILLGSCLFVLLAGLALLVRAASGPRPAAPAAASDASVHPAP